MEKFYLASAVRDEYDWGIACNDFGNIISVNELGLYILNLLNKNPLSSEEITSELLSNFNMDAYSSEEVKQAINDFLSDMIKENMIICSDNMCSDKNSYSSAIYLKPPNIDDPRLFLKSPLNAILLLTDRCNQKCNFCYIDPRCQSVQISELTIEDLVKICNVLIEQRVMTLNILGGEPLARYDDLIRIIQIMEERAPWCHCSFATNATYGHGITKERAIQLNKFKNLSVRISLHGLEKYHDKIVGLPGAYNEAILSMKMLNQYAPNLRWSINATLNKYLVAHYEEFINELFVKHEVQNIEFAPMQYVGHAAINSLYNEVQKANERIALKNLKDLRDYWITKGKIILYGGRYTSDLQSFKLKGITISCGIPNQIIIDTKGDCYFCHMTTGMKQFCGGNIFRNSFTDIWCSDAHMFLIKKSRETGNNCVHCPVFESCQGGCRMSAYLNTGSFQGIDPSCPML